VNIYRINEVAKKLGISKQTLIRYEKKGIFPHSYRNRINHWREYTEDDIQKMARIIGRANTGFTLIEVVMVVVIVAILAVVSIPRFRAFDSMKLNGAVKKMVSDIRYVQQLSVSTHDTYRIRYDTGMDRYDVIRVNDSSAAKDPFSRNNFTVDFRNDTQYRGVDITGVNINNTAGLQFNWQAVPQNSNNATLASEGNISVSYKGEAMRIYIQPGTGTTRVQ
jgi:prepilin-type N-terminal cleavage/methylation domain-containing protein